jgi:hypothetical protein
MRPKNPELEPVRVYNEKGMAVICVKRQPSIALSHHQLQQLQYLLGVEPALLDTAAYLVRELGSEASNRLMAASEKVGLGVDKESDNGSYHGV